METRTPSVLQNPHQVQERRVPSSTPTKVQEPRVLPVEPTAGWRFFRWLCSLVFYIHLCLVGVLVIFLVVQGLRSASKTHHFHPEKWYPPLLTATGSSGIIAFSWQGFTGCCPSKAFKMAFWFSPVVSLAAGIFFVIVGSAGGLAAGAILIVSSLFLSVYVCWVYRRFNYAIRLLSVSTEYPPTKTPIFVLGSILVGILYASVLVTGIGGAVALRSSWKAAFIAAILLSLTWTLQVIKNIVQVTISRIKYLNLARGHEKDTRAAFHDTMKHLIGTISIGSVIAPLVSFIQGSARAMRLMAGESDEFLFSCAHCCSGIASTLRNHGNRWGFVHVGVYNKGMVQASVDTWEAFKKVELEAVIDYDLTVSFCFLCGVSGGAICSIISGIWALVIHKSYATELAIYAFLIGYFLCRIGMAWPQACVSAYYVAYADNPQHPRFDSMVPQRIRELQRRLQA
ncbi:protein PNS1-like isoform X2 [Momordica charantia]|uniref:Choline transporter-like protein n=1 Tax=Momordica charantia TaxID=3673 RepID=A0A6J1DKG3_MOMCH|nr:protein PNS1-like isoform X2 [Momordica charantia]